MGGQQKVTCFPFYVYSGVDYEIANSDLCFSNINIKATV